MCLYGNDKEFKDFIAKADKEQFEKVLYFINVIGFLRGTRKFGFDDSKIISKSIEFAKSNYDYVEDFIIARGGIIL